MKAELLREWDKFFNLEAEWNELLGRSVALERGWLRLYGVQDRGELKVVQIGYRYGDVYHGLQDGFDPGYARGAGHFLRANVIRMCISEGIKAMDFLGDLTQHKRTWLARERLGHDVFVGRPGFNTRLLFARHVWPSGRYLRPEPQPASTALPGNYRARKPRAGQRGVSG